MVGFRGGFIISETPYIISAVASAVSLLKVVYCCSSAQAGRLHAGCRQHMHVLYTNERARLKLDWHRHASNGDLPSLFHPLLIAPLLIAAHPKPRQSPPPALPPPPPSPPPSSPHTHTMQVAIALHCYAAQDVALRDVMLQRGPRFEGELLRLDALQDIQVGAQGGVVGQGLVGHAGGWGPGFRASRALGSRVRC